MSENVPTPTGSGLPARQEDIERTHFDTPFTLREVEDGGGVSLKWLLPAIRRYWWILVLSALAGGGAASVAFHMTAPLYRAEGAIWLTSESQGNDGTGPITQGGLLQSRAWVNLLSSFSVLDPVVLQERLYLTFPLADSLAFRGFSLDSIFWPGRYRLAVAADGRSYTLFASDEMVLEEGVLGDSIGVGRGFRWEAPPGTGDLLRNREVAFTLGTPRDAARNLSNQLVPTMDREGNFLSLELRGPNPDQNARVLNAVMERFVELAADLKKVKLDELTDILREQLDSVGANLREAEQDLERYQVQTVTLPSEETSPIVPGLQQTTAPVLSEYFQLRVSLDAAQRDRARLEEALSQVSATGHVQVEAFEMIPVVAQSSQLSTTLLTLTNTRAELRALQERYHDEWGPVADLIARTATMEETTIPSMTEALLEQLRAREGEIEAVIESRAEELAEIPPRAIEENRRIRSYQIADNLYRNLQGRYETARLAAASSIPDVRILDEAEAVRAAISDQRTQLALIAFFSSLGLGFLLIMVLDRFDPRLRDPAEIGQAMGLEWLGAIPRYRQGTVHGDNSEELREAFRDLRMKLDFAFGSVRPLVISVTSPSEGEGKTFVCANLANAFADLGRRTVLVDGDTRRGDLHHVMARNRKPGLVDFLMNGGSHKVIQNTDNPKLHFVGFGSRSASSPELLNSANMQNFLAGLKRRYEVIIIDSPPMAAGSDPFILAAHTGNVMIVLRSGSTNKELAMAKMESFLRLPVRILGAVLNDFTPQLGQGYYKYYSHYLPGYEASDEEEAEVGVAGS